MENFRELEKELKQSKLNKDHFQNRNEIEGKFKYDSDGGYGDEGNDSDSSYQNNGNISSASNSNPEDDRPYKSSGREEVED